MLAQVSLCTSHQWSTHDFMHDVLQCLLAAYQAWPSLVGQVLSLLYDSC